METDEVTDDRLDDFRASVRREVLAANRGPFGGWWATLLDMDPHTLQSVHHYIAQGEQAGPIPEALRHLIWVAVDAVVTHLYPRGLGVHARIAIDNGATTVQVIDALRVAATVSSRGYGRALPTILQEVHRAGERVALSDDSDRVAILHDRLNNDFDDQVPPWMLDEARINPDALEAFLDLSPAREHNDGLDARSRALVALAVASCPAISDDDLTRLYARRALAHDASPEELLQAIRLANAIGVHSIAEGVMQLQDDRGTGPRQS